MIIVRKLIRIDFSCAENREVQRITFGNQSRFWVQPSPTVVSITEFGPRHISDVPLYTLENGTLTVNFSFYPLSTRYIYPAQ